jgi:hypothetical protein
MPEFNGENYTLGLTAAMGYRQFFFALPVAWTWTELDITDQTIETYYISPRIGLNAPTKKSGALSVFIGGAYLDATAELTGSFTVDTSDIPGAPPESTLAYSIKQSNKDKWNFLVGFNWDVSRSWSAQFEASAGGSRQGFIASGTWRF